MEDVDRQAEDSKRLRVERIIRAIDGKPYSWRWHFDKISAGIEAGHIDLSAAKDQLADYLGLARACLVTLPFFHEPDVSEGLQKRYELMIKETYKFADGLGIVIPEESRWWPPKITRGQSR